MKKRPKFEYYEEPTIYRSDYRLFPIPKEVPSKKKIHIKPEHGRPPPLEKSSETLEDYQTHVPFDTYGFPKPILQTRPDECFKIENPPPSDFSDDIRKTRPRVIEPPQFSFDDVPDERILKILLNYTYKTTYQEASDEINLKDWRSYKPSPPYTTFQLRRDPVQIPCIQFEPLPYGWVHAGLHWDALQSRILGDPTADFWKEKEAKRTESCHDPAKLLPEETKQLIRCFVEVDKLRLPFNTVPQGYGGFRPRAALGVPLGNP